MVHLGLARVLIVQACVPPDAAECHTLGGRYDYPSGSYIIQMFL